MKKLTSHLMIIAKAVPIALLCSIVTTIAFWLLYAWTGHYDKNTFFLWVGVLLFLIITWGMSKDELTWLNWELRNRELKIEEQPQREKMKSYFKARKQEQTTCSKCGEPIYRLADDERQDSPKFNICFKCKIIGHIGVGEVTVSEK